MPCKIQALTASYHACQIMCKGVLQTDAEFVQFHRNHADQTAGKEALKDIDACGFDVGSAVLILNRHVEDGYNRTGHKQRPSKQREKPDCGMHPGQVKDFSAHVAHHGKEVSDGAVDDLIEPLEDGVKDGVGNLCAEILNGISNGIADAGEYISKPVKHRFSPSFPEGL